MSPAETIALIHTIGALFALAMVAVTAAMFPWDKVRQKPSDDIKQRLDELERSQRHVVRDISDAKQYFEAQTDEMKSERSRYLRERGGV